MRLLNTHYPHGLIRNNKRRIADNMQQHIGWSIYLPWIHRRGHSLRISDNLNRKHHLIYKPVTGPDMFKITALSICYVYVGLEALRVTSEKVYFTRLPGSQPGLNCISTLNQYASTCIFFGGGMEKRGLQNYEKRLLEKLLGRPHNWDVRFIIDLLVVVTIVIIAIYQLLCSEFSFGFLNILDNWTTTKYLNVFVLFLMCNYNRYEKKHELKIPICQSYNRNVMIKMLTHIIKCMFNPFPDIIFNPIRAPQIIVVLFNEKKNVFLFSHKFSILLLHLNTGACSTQRITVMPPAYCSINSLICVFSTTINLNKVSASYLKAEPRSSVQKYASTNFREAWLPLKVKTYTKAVILLNIIRPWLSILSCCGLHGGNSYKSKQLPIPESCYKDQRYLKQYAKINNCHMGCFDLVKKLEEKFLDPVIILTFFCSFLQVRLLMQMSNGILILNLLRPKPKPRRYHINISLVYTCSFTVAAVDSQKLYY
ncbi:hypothetical protein QTP88_014204 [Uroleucon formosanum]